MLAPVTLKDAPATLSMSVSASMVKASPVLPSATAAPPMARPVVPAAAAVVPRSCLPTEMSLAATPEDERSSEESTLTSPEPEVVSLFDSMFRPLNWAAPTTEPICSRRALMSVWIFSRSTLPSWEATILPFIWVSRSVTVSEA